MIPGMRMLHLCSGDWGRSAWAEAGLPGEALAWRDSPAVGPWSADPERRASLRARFWELPEAGAAFQEERAALDAMARAGGAVLWFSSEPWDQLAQLWVVAASTREHPELFLELAAVRHTPMDRAFQLRTALAQEDREGAVRLWERFEAEDWPALWKWLHKGGELASLPHLSRALARVLEDRPPHVPGRTERQVRDLQASGVRDLSAMMRALAALEAPYGLAWYGDRVVGRLMAVGEAATGPCSD
jgi:hypothetical protein